MTITAVLLLCLAAKVTYAIECETSVTCPCGSEGINVTVCVPDFSVYEEACASLLKCENCDDEASLCTKCPEEAGGPFCPQEISKFRHKRQSYRYRERPVTGSCPTMDSPKFGSIRCISNSEQQTCTGKCLPGYHFTSSPEHEMVLTCRGGNWSPLSSFPACKSGGHCELNVVGSGSFNCTTGVDGTRCDVRCSGSYTGRYSCYPGRNWEPALPRCVKPKTPVSTSTEVRQSCVCKNGETCDSSGKCVPKGCPTGWSRAECEAALAPGKKFCPDPGFISNGYRHETDGSQATRRRNFEEGESAVYGCTSDEYELKGSFITTCKKDGTWSKPKPSCVKPVHSTVAPRLVCPDPGQVANSIRLNSDGSPSTAVHPAGYPRYPVGHSLVYTCVPGYALERRSLLTCLASGRWSYRTPYCRRIEPPITTTKKPAPDVKWCQDPKVDVNGFREPSIAPDSRGFPVGSQLNFSCKEGYQLLGSRSVFCLVQGWWSEERPRCGPISRAPDPLVYCEYPGDIADGRVYYIPTLNKRRRPSDEREEGYPEGSQLQYSCNDGFKLNGPDTLTCQSHGGWSTVPPTCTPGEITLDYCPNPGPILNGQFAYRPSLDFRRRPTSQPIQVSDPEFPVGARLRYSCHNGHTLVGRDSVECTASGLWSAEPPVCSKGVSAFCEYPGDFGNGEVVHYPPPNEMKRPMKGEEQYPADSRLGYTCDQGFKLKGNAVLDCLRDGTWSAKPPICMTAETVDIMYCQNPGLINDGRVAYHPPSIGQRTGLEPSNLDEYPEGSELEYSCDEGYILVGRVSLICQSTGFWSGVQPLCKPDCGRSFMQTTGKVTNGINTTYGEWPWVVSISRDDNASSPFICGGAVLNAHTVITAAHCLTSSRSLLLRFGKHHFNVQDDDTQVLTRRSSEILVHPDYSERTFDSDIGLITFQQRIRYSHRVQPICLPTRESTVRNIEPGEVGYVGGWGDTERDMPPEKMMLAKLPVVSDRTCEEAYRQQRLSITRNMFCAGYQDARQSVCGGDSGSPLVFYNRRTERYVLEGLVSYGVRGQCGVAGNFAIFTKVFRFVDWILKNLKS